MTASDIINILKTMNPDERKTLRDLLGIAGDYHRVEIDSRTGKPKETSPYTALPTPVGSNS